MYVYMNMFLAYMYVFLHACMLKCLYICACMYIGKGHARMHIHI